MTLSLNHRLSNLPIKSALPFRQLLETGHICEEVLASVLDAGELSGDRHRLIGFAVAFLHLRSQGVPMHDVIRMARHQKRRINLAWSASRWNEEHDRLSRVEALQSMSRDNVHYDLKQYEAHLPARFAGYLIRSRRRLGMEGFRQRHCVASYHEQIQSGAVAIATVFAERQRWTVTLQLTASDERPVRISQIRTRHNGLPSVHVRRQIHHMLGIPVPEPTCIGDGEDADQRLYLENLRRLIPVLRALNLEHVTVSFDGSGDSGCIHDVAYVPDLPKETIDATTVEHLVTEGLLSDGRWHTAVVSRQASMAQVIEQLTYDYLEETGVDWYNDDGGYGDLTIDVERQTISVNVNVRYTRSELEHSADIDIESGLEL